MIITKHKDIHELQYNDNRKPLAKHVVQYLYESEEDRELHASAMRKDGYLDSGKRMHNLGSLQEPDYRIFGEYHKTEYRNDITLVNKDDVIGLLESYKDMSIVDLNQIIPKIKTMPEVII